MLGRRNMLNRGGKLRRGGSPMTMRGFGKMSRPDRLVGEEMNGKKRIRLSWKA
jgi:hypothetical protein